jgi:chromosome segregation ATPase
MRTLVTTLREQVGDLSAQVKDAMKALAGEQARAGELSAQRDAAASAEAGVRLEMNKFVARCATLEGRASEAATTISNLSAEIAADKAEIKR